MTDSVMNLGAVAMHRHHNYRQFFYVVVVVAATAVAAWYSYASGLFAEAYQGMGLGFTVGFSILCVVGLTDGLLTSWFISSNINYLKTGGLDSEQLKKSFNMESFTELEPRLLEEEIRDRLALKVSWIRYFAANVAKLGYAGTVLGILLALIPLRDLQGVDEVFGKLPEIVNGCALAFVTTLVGICISVPLELISRFLDSAATELKSRIFRALHASKTS